MFQATRAVGYVLGGWPATGSLDGHVPAQSGLPGHGQHVTWYRETKLV